MKNVITLLCCVLMCSTVFAQGKMEEVVYLKNGSIIHGMIVEYVPNVSIKIKSGANLFAYKLDEIEKITRETPAVVPGSGFQAKTKGYYGIAHVGLTDFPTGGNLAMASIDIINGYQFNRYFALGLGVGADISTVHTYNVPVFADLRVNFLKTRVTPFFAAGIGYNMQLTQSVDYYSGNTSAQINHGVVFNPSIGVKGYVSNKVALSLAFGYKLLGVKNDYTTYNYYYGSTTTSQFTLSHGLTLMAGVHF